MLDDVPFLCHSFVVFEYLPLSLVVDVFMVESVVIYLLSRSTQR